MPDATNQLYVCCTESTCIVFQRMMEFMQTWGLDRALHADGKREYFEVTIPRYWSVHRRRVFDEAIQNLTKKH